VELPHPIILDPRTPEFAQAIAALPESRGVYLFSMPGLSPHLGSCLNLRRRLTRLLVPSYTGLVSGFARYFQTVTAVSCWPAGSRLEASLLTYQITREHFPGDYLKRLRLRLPWFVALTDRDAFPRLEIINRPTRRHNAAYGPFLSRDSAQRYEQELLGLFQIRRCIETLVPALSHPGCIYGEMNQCLRPCQCAVSRDEYAHEALRLGDFLATNGKTAAAALATARERASAELDFEQAAQLHKRMEKVAAASACRDAAIAPYDQFNGVALARGVADGECRLWPMQQGYWHKPVIFQFSTLEPGARSLDRELRETLAKALGSVLLESGQRVEHLAVFSRWYYSSWRDGQWFPFAKLEDLNYRRLVREISKLTRSASASSNSDA
jgi:excinuclease UvrABC nuclease subunit